MATSAQVLQADRAGVLGVAAGCADRDCAPEQTGAVQGVVGAEEGVQDRKCRIGEGVNDAGKTPYGRSLAREIAGNCVGQKCKCTIVAISPV